MREDQEPWTVVQAYRCKPTIVHMIRWDGTDQAFTAVGDAGGQPVRTPAGALQMWIARAKTTTYLPLGGWAAIEPGGGGVYPVTDQDQRALYKPDDGEPEGTVRLDRSLMVKLAGHAIAGLLEGRRPDDLDVGDAVLYREYLDYLEEAQAA